MKRRIEILFFIAIDHRYFSTQLDGIFRYSQGKGWHVQVVSGALSEAKIRETLEFWKPSGVIVECSSAFKIAPAVFGDVPTVFFDIGQRKLLENANVVGFDSGAAGKMGADYLLELDLPAYSYVGYWNDVLWDRERRQAFTETIRKAGRPVSAFFTKRARPLQPVDRFRKLFAWIRALPRPCGIMACNDRVGEAVLNICARLGIRVPEEIAVLGVDNEMPFCENMSPPLASIDPGSYRSGFFAAQILDELISRSRSGPKPYVHKIYSPLRVEVRQSVRRPSDARFNMGLVRESIRRRACDGIGVEDVVAEMGLSRRAAEKHFRLATGKSILEEIRDVRFERVFELLRDPRRQIGAIAGLCGFATEVALRKAFRLRTGMSMSAWRRLLAQG